MVYLSDRATGASCPVSADSFEKMHLCCFSSFPEGEQCLDLASRMVCSQGHLEHSNLRKAESNLCAAVALVRFLSLPLG